MPTTLDLLQRALEIKPAADWCRDLNVTPSALSKAKKQGHISPEFAMHIAIETGADAAFWTALAVAERLPEPGARKRAMKTLERHRSTVY